MMGARVEKLKRGIKHESFDLRKFFNFFIFMQARRARKVEIVFHSKICSKTCRESEAASEAARSVIPSIWISKGGKALLAGFKGEALKLASLISEV